MIVMATARIRLCAAWFCILPLAGCSQSSMLANKTTTVNNLKASVSQLQFDNDNYKKQVAQLKTEASRSDSELAQERDANGELSARLDDAKDLIRRQNGDTTALKSSSRSADEDTVPPPYSRPQTRRTKTTRKPPAAQIPPLEFDPSGFEDRSLNSRSIDPGPQAKVDDEPWLPVAQAPGRWTARR